MGEWAKSGEWQPSGSSIIAMKYPINWIFAETLEPIDFFAAYKGLEIKDI
jgi:hypothetical protein